MRHTLSLSLALALSLWGWAGEAAAVTWGAAESLATLNTDNDFAPSISADGLTLYFTSIRAGGIGGQDLWQATRASTTEFWGSVTNVAGVNTPSGDFAPSISTDGLTLYFASNRVGGLGAIDLWQASRANTGESWGSATNLADLNTVGTEYTPSISADGLTLYFASDRPGGLGGVDLWQASRASVGESWGNVTNLTDVNSSGVDYYPSVAANGLTIFFASSRAGGLGGVDLWQASRGSTGESWGSVTNLAALNTTDADITPSISASGLTLYFARYDAGVGNYDLWQATAVPEPSSRCLLAAGVLGALVPVVRRHRGC